MKLYRFMSAGEFALFTGGVTLSNHTHHCHHAISKSVGFCFFPADSALSEGDLVASWHLMLRESVKDDVIVCFDVPDDCVTESEGGYHSMTYDTREYCATEYGAETFHMVKWGVIDQAYSSWCAECVGPLTVTWY